MNNIFLRSVKNFRSTKVLTRCAMLLAIEVLLNLVGSISIGQYIRISFGYMCTAVAGLLYGPVPAACVAALADILGTIIKPTGPFFPGFTFSALLGGLIYGVFLWNRQVDWKRIMFAQALICVIINLGLNTYWLDVLYGKGFLAILPARLLKNAIQFVVDSVLLVPLISWMQGKGRKFFAE